ncbi:hypothetical protein Hanom_Chr10g00901081 [Helianthus anomalus]
MFLAKDKKISSLEKEINLLQKELVLAQITAQQEKDPAFDRAEWDQEAWKQRLAELDDEDESKGAAAGEDGGSGLKDPEVTAGGDGEKVMEVVKV